MFTNTFAGHIHVERERGRIKKSNLVLYATEYWATDRVLDTYIFCNEIHAGSRRGRKGKRVVWATLAGRKYLEEYLL